MNLGTIIETAWECLQGLALIAGIVGIWAALLAVAAIFAPAM